jgi:3D (Asp-Asp-Asp) domain-containing protein
MLIAGARTLVCTLLVGTSVRYAAPTAPANDTLENRSSFTALAPRAALSATESAPSQLIDFHRYQPTPIRRVHRVTAYCDRGITAAGVPSGVGQCAAPSDIPFGSLVYVPELGRTFVVTDRTHQRFRHNTVDIFIPDRQDCLEFGLNYLDVEIYLPADPPRYASPKFDTLIRTFASAL